jgi:type I restriction enzyme M protein
MKLKENFTVVVSYEDIKSKDYSLSAGQYFDVKIEYTDITSKEFASLKWKYFKLNS